MKKVLIPLFFLLLLLGSVSAVPMPYVVHGKIYVNDKAWDGKQIAISSNVWDGSRYSYQTFRTTTNIFGEYHFEIANFNPYYRMGDSWDLDICGTDEYEDYLGSQCFEKITILNEGGIQKDISVSDFQGLITKTIYVCWNGKEVFDKDNCPPEEKEEEEEEEDITEPEEGSLEWYHAIIGGLLAVIAGLLAHKYRWGKGFVGLVKYYIRTKDYARAVKMMRTAIRKEKEGKYSK